MRSVVSFFTAGIRIDLLGVQKEVGDLVRRVAAPSLVDCSAGPPTVTIDAARIDVPDDADFEQIAARLLYTVHSAALSATPTLPIHAAALAGPGGCVILPAASGSGKSTLAAAALQRGWTLLSDEAACLTTPVGLVAPHVRPITLSRHSRRLLGVPGETDPEEEIGLSAAIFGRVAVPVSARRCLAVVLPERQPGRAATLEPVDRSEVLAELLRHRLHQDGADWSPERVWTYLTEFVNRVRVATLRFDDPYEAADQLLAWLTASNEAHQEAHSGALWCVPPTT